MLDTEVHDEESLNAAIADTKRLVSVREIEDWFAAVATRTCQPGEQVWLHAEEALNRRMNTPSPGFPETWLWKIFSILGLLALNAVVCVSVWTQSAERLVADDPTVLPAFIFVLILYLLVSICIVGPGIFPSSARTLRVVAGFAILLAFTYWSSMTAGLLIATTVDGDLLGTLQLLAAIIAMLLGFAWSVAKIQENAEDRRRAILKERHQLLLVSRPRLGTLRFSTDERTGRAR